jgi:hypothetical protein
MGSFRNYRQQKKVAAKDSWFAIDHESISFLVSLCAHTAILLIASFICFIPPPTPGIVLSLNFSNNSEDISTEKPNILEWTDEDTKEIVYDTSSIVSTDTETIEIEEAEPAEKTLEITSIENIEKLDLSIAEAPTSAEMADIKDSDSSTTIDSSTTSTIDSLTQAIGGGISANQAMVASVEAGSGIGERLQSYGAKTGDVQISIAWNTTDDIDLHVMYAPGNGLTDNINWTNPIGRLSKGMLDIDMNANGAYVSRTPVENIFWPKNSSPKGHFRVSIHFFRSWSNENRVPVIVRIQSNGKVQEHKITAILYMSPQHVVDFSF